MSLYVCMYCIYRNTHTQAYTYIPFYFVDLPSLFGVASKHRPPAVICSNVGGTYGEEVRCTQHHVCETLWTKGFFKSNFDTMSLSCTDLKTQPQCNPVSSLVP